MKKTFLFKFSSLLAIILVLGTLCAQASNVSAEEVAASAAAVKSVAQGIAAAGLWAWLGSPSNLLLAGLAVIGVGRVIVRLTPGRKDDIWFENTFVGWLHFIGKILQLGRK